MNIELYQGLQELKFMISLIKFHLPGQHLQKSHAGGMSGTQAQDLVKGRGLRIPPNWNNVWINPDPTGKVQAIGVDSKGRHQSIYHSDFSKSQQASKFKRVRKFAKDHQAISDKITKDAKQGKEEAKVMFVINKTGFRIGSESDTKADKQAYGTTTLQVKHISISGDSVTFNFTGKKGVTINKTVIGKDFSEIIKNNIKGKGKSDKIFDTYDNAVRSYVDKISKSKYTPKDFRTHIGTTEAYKHIRELPTTMTKKEYKVAVADVSKKVASVLGNTPAIAKASYIDPSVWDRIEVRTK